MKKIIFPFCLLLILTFCMPFVACNKSGKWQEVQSITYTTTEGTTKLTSMCYYKYDEKNIDETEYNNAPKDLQKTILRSRDDFLYEYTLTQNRQTCLKDINSEINKTFYFKLIDDYHYNEIIAYRTIHYKGFEIKYVKIKLHTDGSFELNYGDEYTRILPTTYKITYFDN